MRNVIMIYESYNHVSFIYEDLSTECVSLGYDEVKQLEAYINSNDFFKSTLSYEGFFYRKKDIIYDDITNIKTQVSIKGMVCPINETMSMVVEVSDNIAVLNFWNNSFFYISHCAENLNFIDGL